MEYEMRLCATSLLKSTAPTDGMYLKGKTRCDVGRANEADGASRGRFRLHIQLWSEPKYSRNKRTRARQAGGRRREAGGKEEGRKGLGLLAFQVRLRSWPFLYNPTFPARASALPTAASVPSPPPSSSSIFLQMGGCIPNWRPLWRRGPDGAEQSKPANIAAGVSRGLQYHCQSISTVGG